MRISVVNVHTERCNKYIQNFQKEEKEMLISIDHGNYAIKTPHCSFISGLSEHTVKPPIADEILEYGGRYWTLSSQLHEG